MFKHLTEEKVREKPLLFGNENQKSRARQAKLLSPESFRADKEMNLWLQFSSWSVLSTTSVNVNYKAGKAFINIKD